MATSSAFSCTACKEDIADTAPIKVNNLQFCRPCFDRGVRPRFESYMWAEELGSVQWEGELVDFDSVSQFFSPPFVTDYQEKMKGYAILPNDRVHCAQRNVQTSKTCERFLGAKTGALKLQCDDCKLPTCSVCAKALSNHSDDDHVYETPIDPLAGLKMGAEVQICPQCKIVGFLLGECNHIICKACSKEYCYVCGEPALAHSGHWSIERHICPRYGMPGSSTAQFDEVMQDMEAEDEDLETDGGDNEDGENPDPLMQHLENVWEAQGYNRN